MNSKRDAEMLARYRRLRWGTNAYNEFVEANRDEYMRRVDETAFQHDHELRIGTFEGVW